MSTILDGAMDLGLRELRVRAASYGIENVQQMSKTELLVAMRAKHEQEQEKAKQEAMELESLRQQCAVKGLSPDGTAEQLRMRLEQAKDGAISDIDNKIYRYAAIACACLCIAALGISLFHISTAISKIMHVHMIFAVLFAIVIDGCIVCFKVIEAITRKFYIGRAELVVKLWIFVCLVMSAALNATSFMQHADTPLLQVMSVFWAIFISFVIWGTSYVAIQMLTKREVKSEKEQEVKKDMANTLREAASKYEQINRLGKIASKILGG